MIVGEFNVVKFTFENRSWETVRMDSLRDVGRLAVKLKNPKEAGSDAGDNDQDQRVIEHKPQAESKDHSEQ